MKLWRVGVFVVLFAAATSWAADEASWLTDFAKAQKAAAEKNLPILVDFSGSDWCGWCIKLEKEVLSQKEFQDFAKDSVILFVADFPRQKKQSDEVKKQNDALAKKYGIEGFPTVLLLGADGKELARTGYQPGGAVAYVEHLKGLLKARPAATPHPTPDKK